MDDVRQEFTTIAEEHRATDNQSDIAERVSEDDCLLMFFFFFMFCECKKRVLYHLKI